MRFEKVSPNVLRIGDGAALTRRLSYYKIVFGTSKIVKLAIPPHYCQYDVICRFFYHNQDLKLPFLLL